MGLDSAHVRRAKVGALELDLRHAPRLPISRRYRAGVAGRHRSHGHARLPRFRAARPCDFDACADFGHSRSSKELELRVGFEGCWRDRTVGADGGGIRNLGRWSWLRLFS